MSATYPTNMNQFDDGTTRTHEIQLTCPVIAVTLLLDDDQQFKECYGWISLHRINGQET